MGSSCPWGQAGGKGTGGPESLGSGRGGGADPLTDSGNSRLAEGLGTAGGLTSPGATGPGRAGPAGAG
eukprot:7614928-Pyramimonas_sp.AAC.1